MRNNEELARMNDFEKAWITLSFNPGLADFTEATVLGAPRQWPSGLTMQYRFGAFVRKHVLESPPEKVDELLRTIDQFKRSGVEYTDDDFARANFKLPDVA